MYGENGLRCVARFSMKKKNLKFDVGNITRHITANSKSKHVFIISWKTSTASACNSHDEVCVLSVRGLDRRFAELCSLHSLQILRATSMTVILWRINCNSFRILLNKNNSNIVLSITHYIDYRKHVLNL